MTIQISGVYYISINVGAISSRALSVNIQVDGTNQGALSRFGTWHNGLDTLSRSIVLRLQQGSKVRIWADGGASNTFYIWSDVNHKLTSFIGFLVYT